MEKVANNTVKDLKKRLKQTEIITETDLENIMFEYGYILMDADEDAENIIKYTNFNSQIWIDIVGDKSGNILVDNVRQVTKEKGKETEVEPFHSFEDLKAVQDYFRDKKKYEYWLIGYLMAAFGRRVEDIMNLKWSDLFYRDGKYRERLELLVEKKTGKRLGIAIYDFPKARLEEYMEMCGKPDLINNYDGKIVTRTSAAFREALSIATEKIGIRYPVSTHSYRKYFGNLMYQLHPNDADRIKTIQYIFGHSSEEITKRYIGAVNTVKDNFVQSVSTYMESAYAGKEYTVDNSPVITIRTQDLRKIVTDIYLKGKNGKTGENDTYVINELVTAVENLRVK